MFNRLKTIEGDAMMSEQRAKEILKSRITDTGLEASFDTEEYIHWEAGDQKISLDGEFSREELAALSWWMENNNG